MARQYPPGLYRLKPTGQKVVLICYSEEDDGSCRTCRVSVSPAYNPECLMPREVFGIEFKDLEPVDILE